MTRLTTSLRMKGIISQHKVKTDFQKAESVDDKVEALVSVNDYLIDKIVSELKCLPCYIYFEIE